MKKKLSVVWDIKAKEALKLIYDYYYVKSPQGAQNIINDILKAVKKIPSFPQKHSIDPDLGKSYRRIVVRHYLIIFSISSKTVKILDVFDARQNPNKKLK